MATDFESYGDGLVVTTSDGEYRVRVTRDEDPSQPYDDGGSPILRREYSSWRGVWTAEQMVMTTSYRLHPSICEAFERFGRDLDTWERYCRIFHGATSFAYYTTRGGDMFVTLDPAEWREEVGAPEGSANLDEWRAYCEGDVFGYTVERRVREYCEVRTLAGEELRASARFAWEHVDSCWGFYGLKWAQEAALEALEGVRDEG